MDDGGWAPYELASLAYLACEYMGKWGLNSEFIRFGGENEYKVNSS